MNLYRCLGNKSDESCLKYVLINEMSRDTHYTVCSSTYNSYVQKKSYMDTLTSKACICTSVFVTRKYNFLITNDKNRDEINKLHITYNSLYI